MKISTVNFANSAIIRLQNSDWLEKQRIAGKVAAKALSRLLSLVEQKTELTLLELSKEAENIILSEDCTPTFKGYKSFPEAVCISVNKQLVHGIPTSYKLQEGDIVKFDLGATYKGVIADTAVTCIFGKPKSQRHVDLVKNTEAALLEGIRSIKVGSRLGVVGYAINSVGKRSGLAVVTEYGGHGITMDKGVGIPHASPFVPNKSNPNEGIVIQPGLTIAIEPMFILGSSAKTKVSKDGWSVLAEDVNAHWEHTVYVHEDHVEILTQRN